MLMPAMLIGTYLLQSEIEHYETQSALEQLHLSQVT